MMNEADYLAIEEAVLATARGRWFLAEYARRIRATETDRILLAIENLASRSETPTAMPAPATHQNTRMSEILAAIDALPLSERLKLTG